MKITTHTIKLYKAFVDERYDFHYTDSNDVVLIEQGFESLEFARDNKIRSWNITLEIKYNEILNEFATLYGLNNK